MTELEEKLQARLNKSIEVYKEQQAKIVELENTVSSLNKELEIQQQQTSILEDDMLTSNASVKRLTNELNERDTKIADLEEVLADELNERNTKIADLEKMLKEAADYSSDLQANILNLTKEKEELKLKVSNLTKQLESAMVINEVNNSTEKQPYTVPIGKNTDEPSQEIVDEVKRIYKEQKNKSIFTPQNGAFRL